MHVGLRPACGQVREAGAGALGDMGNSMVMDALYLETILDHYRRPRNKGVLEPCDGRGFHRNTACGDEVTVYLRLRGERLEQVGFEARGCAICLSSASMMTEALTGLSRGEALRFRESFLAVLRSEEQVGPAHAGHALPPGNPSLGELDSLRGVKRYPARIACAELAWEALKSALDDIPLTADPNRPSSPTREEQMPVRSASAVWEGTLREGRGEMKLGSGAFEGAYSFGTRFEETPGTNPEELIGAALAGCFSMAFSAGLEKAGYPATRIASDSKVHLEKKEEGFRVTRIDLVTEAEVPGISDDDLQQQAEGAKNGCPISNALGGVMISLNLRRV